MHVESGKILAKILSPFSAGDRHDVATLLQEPGDRDLRRRAALLRRQFAYRIGQFAVALEIRALEARELTPSVVLGEFLGRFDLTRDQSAAERTVRHEADAQLATGRQHLRFDATLEQ